MRRSLLIAGTTSDAGKSVVTTALCRALARRGVSVAPFKAQNMSNNSMVTTAGTEIGRAQWIQSVAAQAEPETAMNPVLLKPGSDRRSHVIVMGQPAGTLDAGEFASGRKALARAAFEAFDDLSSRYDVVVCEGAGSPAEINLRANDYVNMGLAQHGQIPTLIVGDIDRGGVFAAMFGSLALLDAADQALVSGFIINKFRGDVSLLAPGLDTLRELTDRPMLGVLPWQPGLWLDSEDSLALSDRGTHTLPVDATPLSVAVVRFPRISNFTDIDALCLEPGLQVSFVDHPRQLAQADIVVLPGTRATLGDLAWLRERGLAEAIAGHARRGGVVLGICGGFQMLGAMIEDPHGIEGEPATAEGLGLLDIRTTFGADKTLRLAAGRAYGAHASGYEIHHGAIERHGGDEFLGGARSGAVFGTMWHGSLENDDTRSGWLREASALLGLPDASSTVSFPAAREARLETLADLAEEHLDIDHILEIASGGAPSGMRTVTGGLA
ncbi:cobyric acid synthase [Tomitella biformata]|uniref:cobyric acid synthase n=1 Tax=Tomitella biformata TaxID=630403 RepID=UPI000466E5ED|nr:cobyric acid synthase [Tomitella biformata]